MFRGTRSKGWKFDGIKTSGIVQYDAGISDLTIRAYFPGQDTGPSRYVRAFLVPLRFMFVPIGVPKENDDILESICGTTVYWMSLDV
jgi:hypothetical protein